MKANFNKLLIQGPYILFNCLTGRVASRTGHGVTRPRAHGPGAEGDLE